MQEVDLEELVTDIEADTEELVSFLTEENLQKYEPRCWWNGRKICPYQNNKWEGGLSEAYKITCRSCIHILLDKDNGNITAAIEEILGCNLIPAEQFEIEKEDLEDQIEILKEEKKVVVKKLQALQENLQEKLKAMTT